jgi:hypothetical protein
MPVESTIPTTLDEVEDHNRAVRRRSADRVWYRQSCPGCLKPGPFAPHELRRRGLRLVVKDVVLGALCVVCTTVWLARWRCRKCDRVFTDYPDFRTAL